MTEFHLCNRTGTEPIVSRLSYYWGFADTSDQSRNAFILVSLVLSLRAV